METELRKAAAQIVDRAPLYLDLSELDRRGWEREIFRLLVEDVIEIGPNLCTGPDVDAMAAEFIAICGGNAAEAERVVTRSRRFA